MATDKEIEAAAKAAHSFELTHGYISREWAGIQHEDVYRNMMKAALTAAEQVRASEPNIERLSQIWFEAVRAMAGDQKRVEWSEISADAEIAKEIIRTGVRAIIAAEQVNAPERGPEATDISIIKDVGWESGGGGSRR